jgi:hypothetical protein
VQKLSIADIGYDQKYYPRVNGKEDWLTVHRYAEVLRVHPEKADARKKGSFPAVVVVRSHVKDWKWILLDGLHRLRAFYRASLEEIWASVEDVPRSKWLALSVELNIDSKRGLDTGDKRWVAMRLEEEGWKPERIACLLNMTQASFEKIRGTNIHQLKPSEVEKIQNGRGNRQIGEDRYGFLKAPFGDATDTASAVAVLQHQGSVTAHDAAQIVHSFVALLESKCYDLTDEDTRSGLKRVKVLLDEAMQR